MSPTELLRDYVDMYGMVLHTLEPANADQFNRILSRADYVLKRNDEYGARNLIKHLISTPLKPLKDYKKVLKKQAKDELTLESYPNQDMTASDELLKDVYHKSNGFEGCNCGGV